MRRTRAVAAMVIAAVAAMVLGACTQPAPQDGGVSPTSDGFGEASSSTPPELGTGRSQPAIPEAGSSAPAPPGSSGGAPATSESSVGAPPIPGTTDVPAIPRTSGVPATSGPGSGAPPSGTGATGRYPNTDTIKYAYEEEWYSYNAGTSHGDATANAVPLNQVLIGFVSIDRDGLPVINKDFGDVEKVADSPLTVKYTVNPKAVWSDGQPIGCADFLLNWAAHSGRYNIDATINNYPSESDPTRFLFKSASITGYDQTEKPTCKAGDRTFNLVYKTPFVDWQTLVGGLMPAHVAAAAGGITTNQLVAAIDTDDIYAMAKTAEFWNTGWDLDKGKGLPAADLIPASGPYYVSAWRPGQSVTLKANTRWWGAPAKTGTVVIRFIAQENQAPALENGDVDIIGPQPSPDVAAGIRDLGDQVTAQFYDSFTREIFDLSVNGVFKNEKVREAFFRCAPRRQIVHTLVKPANPNAQVLDSLMWMPFQSEYADVINANGFSKYSVVDIAGAKAAFSASGAKPGVKIRVIRITPNSRRDNEVALLKAVCDPVGFDIDDTPLDSKYFGRELSSGNYDIALFARAGSGQFGAISSLYTSNGAQNHSGWGRPTPNKTLDDALKTVNVTLDASTIPPLLATADAELARNMWSLPLFAVPGVTAFAPDIEGVHGTPARNGDTWNMQDWVRAGK